MNRINPVSFFLISKSIKKIKKIRGEGCHTSDLVAQKNTRGGREEVKRKMSIVVLIFLLIFQYNTTSTTTTMTAVARGNIYRKVFWPFKNGRLTHGSGWSRFFCQATAKHFKHTKRKERKERRSLYNPWPHLHPIAAIQWKAAPAASQPRRGSRCNPSFRYVCVLWVLWARVWMDGWMRGDL